MADFPVVRFPPKLEPVITKAARYKVMHGGRGSGKSWSVARAIVLRMASTRCRVLCTREVQKSLKESVHALLADQIRSLGFGPLFQILETEIRCPSTGSNAVFGGLQSHTVDSIKSFEGCDLVWVEEAQAVSEKSWDVLIPTIRKPKSEIWITFNPQLETDPTYQRFVANPPPGSIVVEMNYSDNPWFPHELELERLHAKSQMSASKYGHIWEGRCMPAVDGAIYFDEIAQAQEAGRVGLVPFDPLLKVHTVWDLGWNDSMSIILAQRQASGVRVIKYIEDSHRTLSSYAQDLIELKFDGRAPRWGSDWLPHDGFTKDFKTGKTAQEILQALGRTVDRVPNMTIKAGIDAAREVFPRVYLHKPETVRLVECLKRYRRDVSQKTGEPGQPVHDEFSHGADCWRYLALCVDQMHNEDWGGKPLAYKSLGYA